MKTLKIINIKNGSAIDRSNIEIIRISEDKTEADTICIQFPNFSGLFFNIAGKLHVFGHDLKFKFDPHQYQLINVSRGEATVEFSEGQHRILIVIIPLKFIRQFSEAHPKTVNEFVDAVKSHRTFTSFQRPNIIPREMEATIKLLYNLSYTDKALEDNFRYQMIVSLLLVHLQFLEPGVGSAAGKKDKGPDNDASIQNRVTAAYQILAIEYKKAWTIDRLAEKIGLDKVTLSKQFKKRYNQYPMEYLHDFRLDKAKQILKEEAQKVSNLAHQVGYKNISAFTRAFHKRFGYAPSRTKPNDFPKNNDSKILPKT